MKELMFGKQLSAGKSYLLKIDQGGSFATVDGPEELGKIRGELRLLVGQAEKGRIEVYLPQFGLVGPGISLRGEKSGRLSVRGLGGTGHISFRKEQWVLKLDFKAEFLYELIGRKLGYIQVAEDVFNAPVEKFQGRITGIIEPKEEPSGLFLSEGRIHLVYQEGGLGLIRSLLIFLERMPFARLGGKGRSSKEVNPAANNPCHPDLEVNRRTLRIQPVGFRSSSTDANPTGTSAARQFNAANAIWGKCCIQFDVQPIHLITDATMKTSSNTGAIRDSYTDQDSNTIEVFFVDNNLANVGGGVCYSGNTALAKVVISDNNVGNDNLLAHELGHALSLLHPTSPSAPSWWVGDEGTVLVPTGSATIANPDENTHWNCINADNPAMTTETATCCLTHDITDHYIRDFPEDLGTEPAVAPSGRNFFSMSNLWNRLSNTPGGVTSDGQPEHQHPVRFNLDGTPYQNYMFAKVEAIVDLPPRDMVVKFFLKHPGSGGGAANINFLGSTPVPITLRPGHPETESFAWQVPTGTPQHSCMFAIVRSPSEPDQDITELGFRDVEAVIRSDNDWVQRNLEVGDYPAGNIYGGQNNNIWTAPIIIAFPFQEGKKPLPVFLAVNAQEARRLVGLAVEIPGRERHKVDPGSVTEIQLSTLVKPGQDLPLVIEAIIPGEAEVDEIFSVDINPTLGETPLIGFSFQIRISKAHRFLSQIQDIALAAFQDYAEITGSEVADKLAWLHRESLREMPCSPHRFLKWLAGYGELFEFLTKELSKIELPENVDVVGAFKRFLKALSRPENLAALSCYRDAVSRLQMLVCIIHRKPTYKRF